MKKKKKKIIYYPISLSKEIELQICMDEETGRIWKELREKKTQKQIAGFIAINYN